MDQATALALVIAAVFGMLATLAILRRERHARERSQEAEGSPLAVSTEGEKICPHCGMGNLWTDANCVSCGTRLPG